MVCSEFVMCYPPGIPILAPGERITEEILELYRVRQGQGLLHDRPGRPGDLTPVNVLT